MRFFGLYLGIVGLDQLIKYWARQSLPLNDSLPVIEPFLYWTYVRNEGAAFGFFQGMNWILVLCAVIVIGGALLYILAHRPQTAVVAALALIAGGATGNLIDRLIFGGVIDYIDVRIWPVFNLADMAIVAGSLLIIIFVGFAKEEEGKPWKH
ncbi:MAG: signal peptidase II [Syntrophomonadales bacterium]|jgi:signal peptidase II